MGQQEGIEGVRQAYMCIVEEDNKFTDNHGLMCPTDI